MLARWILNRHRAGYKAVATLARAGVAKLKERASESDSAEPAISEAAIRISSAVPCGTEDHTLPASPTMRHIRAEHPRILAQIGWMAEQGVVVDGPPLQLRSNLEAELAEHRCLLVADKLTLQAGLQHLDGRFPPVPEPEPLPPVPPRRRQFQPLGDLLAQRPNRPLH